MAKTASKNPSAKRQRAEPKLSSAKESVSADQDARKKILHIGVSSAAPNKLPGGFKPEEWECTRLDPDASVKPDLHGHVHEMKGVEAASFDAIWIPHVLHRLYPHIGEAMLQKAYRALKDEGVLVLNIPDAQLAATYFAHNRPQEVLYKAPAGDVTAHDILYGFSKNLEKGLHQFSHRSGYTTESLSTMLREAGFCSITIRAEGTDLLAIAYRFDYDNPRRVEKVSVVYPKAGTRGHPAPPNLPQAQTQAQAPQAQTLNHLRIDNLDQPPLVWKPLGLKK